MKLTRGLNWDTFHGIWRINEHLLHLLHRFYDSISWSIVWYLQDGVTFQLLNYLENASSQYLSRSIRLEKDLSAAVSSVDVCLINLKVEIVTLHYNYSGLFGTHQCGNNSLHIVRYREVNGFSEHVLQTSCFLLAVHVSILLVL